MRTSLARHSRAQIQPAKVRIFSEINKFFNKKSAKIYIFVEDSPKKEISAGKSLFLGEVDLGNHR